MSDHFPGVNETRVNVPLGGRVIVKSDFLLDVVITPGSTAIIDQFVAELDRVEGPSVVIVAGGLFGSMTAASQIPGVFAAYPSLKGAIEKFLQVSERKFFVLPGDREQNLNTSDARHHLESIGITVTEHLVLNCTKSSGTKKVLVTTLRDPGEVNDSSQDQRSRPWLSGINMLESPGSAPRFVSSRVLYRRLSHYIWVPPIVALIAAVVAHITFVAGRLRRIGQSRTHRVIIRFIQAPWHLRFLWVLMAVILAEVVLGVVVTLVARRVFATSSRTASQSRLRGQVTDDASVSPQNVGQDSLDMARDFIASGGTGVILGGPMAATLTHLNEGFLAIPGASSMIVREHYGRAGLPPLFLEHYQDSEITLELGAELHVQLELLDRRLTPAGRFERLVAAETVTTSSPQEQGRRLIAAWPLGGTWPPPSDVSNTQKKARRIRRIAAVTIFATGLFDLLLAVVPPLRSRLHGLITYFPLGVSQTATVAVVVIGIALVMLSRGILRGQRRAWLVTVGLLAISSALHVAQNARIGAVIIAVAVLMFLLIERRWFQGTTDRGSLRSAIPILIMIVAVAVAGSFIGIELSNPRKGTLVSWPLVLLGVTERLVGLSGVSLPDRVDDFVYPSMLSVGIVVGIAIVYFITRPVVDRRLSSHGSTRERTMAQHRARDIVTRHGEGTLDYFALRDDKQYFFYGDSLVAYAVFGGIALVSPDPIGPQNERTQVWGAFRSFCDAHGWNPAVIGAGISWLPIYDESGMRWLYLGDEAVVDVLTFSLEGKKMKGLRQACTRLKRNGYTVEFLDPATIDPQRVPALAALMVMNRRGDDERGFSMMLGRLFDPKDTRLLLTIVTGPDGAPAAMCQFVPSNGINGYSLDLMRRDPGEHPNGLSDFALCSSIEHLRAQGVAGLSLNFSAFRSTLDGEKGNGVTQRVERWGLRRLSSILPIETLWKFNEKYQPNWLARHLVYASPEYFVPTVAAALRAESLTEIPIVGRFMAQDPVNRPGTVVPEELLEGLPISQSDEA